MRKTEAEDPNCAEWDLRQETEKSLAEYCSEWHKSLQFLFSNKPHIIQVNSNSCTIFNSRA